MLILPFAFHAMPLNSGHRGGMGPLRCGAAGVGQGVGGLAGATLPPCVPQFEGLAVWGLASQTAGRAQGV